MLRKKLQINVERRRIKEVADLSCLQKKKVHICVRVNPDIDPKTHFKIQLVNLKINLVYQILGLKNYLRNLKTINI